MAVEEFFSQLSERLYNENSLSDITWALCKADIEFQDVFLNYCFKLEKRFCYKPIDLQREYVNGYSRADFYFEFENEKFLIEVKINDKDDHFDKYTTSFIDTKKALIANYKYKSYSDYAVSDWNGFYNLLKEFKKDNLLISGYREYLKNVINYVEIKKMNLSNIESIMHFNSMVENIINNYNLKKCQVYKSLKSHSELWSGKFFEFEISYNKYIYPWFGLDFEYPGIWLVFEEGLCVGVINRLKDINHGDYFERNGSEEANNEVWFKLKDDLFNELNGNSLKVEEQIKIVNNFFCEVMSHLH